MTEQRSASSLTPGLRLGPYEITAPLGAGGMGMYRATDTRLGRDVALKILPRAFASDPDRLARFEREARAVAALSHPNILALFDVGTHDGTVYAVMELLEGETLRARIAGGPLPARKATDYAAQAARGLAAAHDKGIVHRDLKPENLFVTGDGRVKVLDFGLARQQEPAGGEDTRSPTLARPTDAGSVLGTVGYMSPEQVRGELVDTRSDTFSLGCVLYEMLAGRRAFQRGNAAETMTAILREDPPELAASGARVSPALERVIRRCLEKKPGERFRSAEDLAFALETVGGSSESGTSGVAPVLRARLGGGRVLPAAGILAALALGVSKPGPNVVYPAWSPDGARIAVTRGDRVAFYELGGALPADPAGPEFDVGRREDTSGKPAFASGFLPYAWSPDGRLLAGEQRRRFSGALYGRRGIVLFEPDTGRDRVVSGDGNSPEWLPDSRRLLMGSGGSIVVLDTATGATRAVLPDAGLPQSWGHEIALSNDGRHLAWIESQGEGDVWLLDLQARDADRETRP